MSFIDVVRSRSRETSVLSVCRISELSRVRLQSVNGYERKSNVTTVIRPPIVFDSPDDDVLNGCWRLLRVEAEVYQATG